MRCLRPSSSLILAVSLIAAASIWAQPAPTIRAFAFRQYEGGPIWGVGQTAASGDTLVFTFEAAGLKSVETDDETKIRFEWEAAVLDPKGKPLTAPIQTKQATEILPEDKNWVPKLTGSFRLPDFLAAGEYKVQIVLSDTVGKTSAKGEFPFAITGPALQHTSALSAQRVRFLRNEEEGTPLDPPAYVPGDTVWARFEMTGFAPSAEGEVHVVYGLKVNSPTGKLMFEQAVAAEEHKKAFYPPAYLPGIVSLVLDRKVAKGAYTITLKIEDRVSGTTAESTHSFRVE